MTRHHFITPVARLSARLARPVAIAGLLAGSAQTMAQDVLGILEYGPPGSGPIAASPVSVPTMGGAGLALLSVALVFIFWRMHRRGALGGARLMVVALLSGALATGLGGVKLVSDAVAQSGVFRDMTNPAGGSLGFGRESPSFGCVRNATDVDLEVLAMTGQVFGIPVMTDPECEISHGPGPHDNPACEVGMVLAPSEVCGAFTGFNASDIRLKADVVPAGVHHNGLALYEFRYLDGTTRYRGVMAQDVLSHTPEAVVVMANGYLAVDYGLLGMEMIEVR